MTIRGPAHTATSRASRWEQAADVARRALATPGVELVGLMAHLGRHSAHPEVWRGMAGELCRRGRARSARRSTAGGRRSSTSAAATPRRATRSEDEPAGPPIEDIAAALTSGLRAGLRAAGIDPAGIRLEAEPGRSLYADTGIQLATVRHLKEQAEPVPMRWVETARRDVHGRPPDRARAVSRSSPPRGAGAPDAQTADVVGMSCGFDLLAADAPPALARTRVT